MDVRSSVDPVRMGEEIFYRIFHHIFHDEGARNHFEFSQINFFNNVQGLPGWNLWFRKNTGVFQIVLWDARETPSTDNPDHLNPTEKFVEGRFLIRYFPGSEDPDLDDFSCAEVVARFSPLFDNTGTPTLDGQKKLHETYFVVGYLDFRTHTNRNFIELECIAQNRWKDIRTDGLYLKNNENIQFQAVKPGEIDRSVPGWNLSFFLFDKLISGFGYTFKTEPCASILAQKKGVQFEIDKNNYCIEKESRKIDLFHLIVGFETKSCSCSSPCLCAEKDRSITKTFIHTTTERMTKQGFQISEVWSGHGKLQTLTIKPEWWMSKNLQFASDMETEMQHCCYHDH